mgnify:CR=1 FL=1
MPTASSGRVVARLVSVVLLVLAMAAALVGPAAPARASFTELIFSEYIEGSGDNKALEIYNGTGAAIDLAANGYNVQMYFNGNASPGLTINLTGTVAPGDVYVLAHASANSAILALADQTNNAGWFNGDDAVVLRRGTTIIDVIGQIGVDPGTEWGAGGRGTADNTLRRKAGITQGDTDGSDPFDPSVEWDIFDLNTFDGLGCHLDGCGASADAAPSVSAVAPSNGATNVPVNTNISVTFSEPVNAPAGAFALSCGGGAVTFALSGGPTVFTLDPQDDLPEGANCTLTIAASQVSDQDTDDPPDTMEADFASTFTTFSSQVVITPIHAIQGSGDTAAAGTFTVEAIVVGSYQSQGSGQLRGFFLQEEDEDADADPTTSEGIFVFCGNCPVPVAVGDLVRVTGASSEYFGMSQLTASTADSVTVLASGQPLPTPATVTLPVPGVPSGNLEAATAAINAYYEQFEGMLVTFPATLTVSEYFELARYGQVILSQGGRPRTFTAISTPSAAGLTAHQIDLARRTIILDDTDNRQNRPVDTPNTPYFYPVPGLSITNFFRGGDTITGLTGVLHWSFAGQAGTDAWRIRPVTEAFSYTFTPANPRPAAAPAVPGNLKVASFNVLNYFLTIDTADVCGPTQDQDCRGADSVREFERQHEKLIAALRGLDADVIGLMEMENTPGVEPLANIVADLPGYAYVDTGVIGSDTIRVGIIYRTSTVQPVGAHAVLDSPAFVNPRNASSDRNRPAVAQTFEETASGARFTVVVNHLKSKGSSCGVGDDDTTTGQGNCNLTRTLSAYVLAQWLASDPTGSGDPDFLIIGDLNSYAMEDPIVALQNAGYTDLVAAFGGPGAYGYVFDGQLGYLDHALSSPSMTPQVVNVAEWHINADEIPLFDYNDDERTADEAAFDEESDSLPLYEPNEFRTSDHDPIIIGLLLDGTPPTTTASVSGTTNPLCPGDCFQGSATVTLSASDSQLGVASTQYRVNGGAFQTYSGPFTVSAEGANLVEFFSSDPAGNVEATKSVIVKVTNFPVAEVLDSFDRPNGRLGSSWQGETQADQYAINGGAVRSGQGGLALWRTPSFGADQVASMRLTQINPQGSHHTLALKARGSNGSDGVILVSYDAVGQQVVVEALVPSSGFQTLGSFPATMAPGGQLGARALSDGTVRVYVNCELVGTVDTTGAAGNTYTNQGGRIGVWFHNTPNAAFDDFGGGNAP